jgi:hypothetical protein
MGNSLYLDVDKVLRFLDKRTISTVNALFNLACSSRPLTHTPYDLENERNH